MENHHRRVGVLRPEDIVAIGFIVALTILIVLLPHHVQSPAEHIIRNALVVGCYALILDIYRHKKNSLTTALRHWYPVMIFAVVYRGLASLIFIIVPHELDPFFINIDNALFGCQPCLWFDRVTNPWLTEILQISYTTYYYFPTLLGLWLYVKQRDGDYHNLLLAISITLYGSFVGFLLVPVLGPRFYLSDLFAVPLAGKFFAPLITKFMNITSIRGGAFPSAHSAVALITLVFAFRYARTFFYAAFPVMMALFLATIYGRYHYVSDVLAGLALGGLSAFLAPRVNAWWHSRIHGERHSVE